MWQLTTLSLPSTNTGFKTTNSQMKIRGLLYILVFLAGIGSAYSQDLHRYNIFITLPKGGSVSGLCILRMDENGGAMSVINEFGIKAFDAIYTASNGKVKLHNVIGPLDKWYIRRVIAKDMSVLFHPDKKLPKHRSVLRKEDGSILLTNKCFKINYHLHPIDHAAE